MRDSRHTPRPRTPNPFTRARRLSVTAAAVQALLLGTAVSLAWPIAAARAQQPAIEAVHKSFNVPAGALEDALNTFARQAGITLSFDPALVQGKRAATLAGSYEVIDALRRLLAGHGVTSEAQFDATGKLITGYVLARARNEGSRSDAASETTLPAVRVKASAAPSQLGYRAESTDAVAPGLSQRETPAVVNVVTSDFLRDTGASRFTDVLNYVPGVTTADNVGSPADRLTIRGFPLAAAAVGVTGTYFNGMRQAVTSGQYRSLDNIERVEIVKGPAGVEASISDPGGFINFISKKPKREFAAEAKAGFGDYGYRTFGIDLTGPVFATTEVQYRLIAAHNELAAWRPGRKDRPQDLLAPSLNWDYATGSHVTLEYEQLKTNDPLDRGTVYLRGAGFKDDFAGTNWSYHQASDTLPTTSRRIDLDWTHQIAPGWRAKLRLQRMKQDQLTDAIRNNDTSAIYAPDGLGWSGATAIPIYISHDRVLLEARSAELSLQGDFQLAGVESTVNAGISKNRGRDAFVSHDGDYVYWDNGNSVELFAPNNHQTVNVTGTYLNGDFRRGSDLKSFYGQWVARWTPAWRTVFSARRDHYDGFAVSETLDGTPPGYHPTVSNRLTSWRLASSYDATEHVTLFAGYGNSFVPQAGADRGGAQIDPLRAQSIEAGVKTSLYDGKALWTNSLFQITQDHQTVCDPIDPVDCKYLLLYGKVRMRGVESELVGQVSPNLQLSGGLALMDPKILQNGDGYAGNQYPNVPRVQASGFASYRWGAFGMPQLSTRLGVMRVGERQGNSGNTYQLPAYTRVDAGVSYAFNPKLSLDFNVENLFDKAYYTSAQDEGTAAGQVGVGNRRLMQMVLRMKM